MRFLVIFAHPLKTSFQADLHQHAVEALRSGGHEVDDCDLYAEDFQAILSSGEMATYHDVSQNLATTQSYVDRLRAAEGLVFIFPTWWYGLPAILKGYFDRVWLPGVCFDIIDGKTKPRLQKITKLVVITTCGSPYWLNKFYVGDQNRKFFTRGVGRLISSKARKIWLVQYNMDSVSQREKLRFKDSVLRVLRAL